MKVVILAGGLGTRISEETDMRPKPMVEIGGRPIIEHIMRSYSRWGFNDFIICCGYKGYMLKEYFLNYSLHNSDLSVNFKNHSYEVTHADIPDWRVTLVDTGQGSMTGGRIKRIRDYVGDSDFLLTYGDGLADVNIPETIKFHRTHGGTATLLAIKPPSRFGMLKVGAGGIVTGFDEKPTEEGSRINGGFFVLSSAVFNYIVDDSCVFETDVLPHLATIGELYSFKHDGFWHCMDTLRDKRHLEDIIAQGMAPWLRD